MCGTNSKGRTTESQQSEKLESMNLKLQVYPVASSKNNLARVTESKAAQRDAVCHINRVSRMKTIATMATEASAKHKGRSLQRNLQFRAQNFCLQGPEGKDAQKRR